MRRASGVLVRFVLRRDIHGDHSKDDARGGD
jgi:hypothetical protein